MNTHSGFEPGLKLGLELGLEQGLKGLSFGFIRSSHHLYGSISHHCVLDFTLYQYHRFSLLLPDLTVILFVCLLFLL